MIDQPGAPRHLRRARQGANTARQGPVSCAGAPKKTGEQGCAPARPVDILSVRTWDSCPFIQGGVLMIRKLMLTALIALGLASAAHAATAPKTTARHPAQRSGTLSLDYIGPRVGFSVSPDQAVVGGHLSATFA